tara:strand:+ start:833 stop:1525 length:693 start_codon:yes stop_codon:yes gene_type:complete
MPMTEPSPVIGVTGAEEQGHVMWFCNHLGIRWAGGRARRLTASRSEDFQNCDGFLISGGGDIDPALYGEENTASFNVEPARDTLEQAVISHALSQGKPLAGICRGAQMINIVKGGSLHQNARNIYKDFLPTTSLLGKIFLRRSVRIVEEGLLSALYGDRRAIRVNSIHHQAIARLGQGLIISAQDRHGIAQAIETSGDDCYLLGVQWHPELMLYNQSQRRFFRQLVQACR